MDEHWDIFIPFTFTLYQFAILALSTIGTFMSNVYYFNSNGGLELGDGFMLDIKILGVDEGC
jgi:hypothetical protein